jgi:hypothetical protein
MSTGELRSEGSCCRSSMGIKCTDTVKPQVLAKRLTLMGLPESEGFITIKVGRGHFSMVSDSGDESDWSGHSKAGLTACFIGAAIFAVSLIGWGLWTSAEYERQANTNSGHYSAYTGRKIAETCVTIAPLENAKCVYEARDQEQQHRYDQNDLAAQRKSALWATIMGLAAVVGMILSVLGVWLVKTTFDETRKANEIAKTQARAAVLASDAYLLVPRGGFTPIQPGNPHFPEGAYIFTFGCQIENVGMTLAKDARLHVQLYTMPPASSGVKSETTYHTCMKEITKVGDVQNGGSVAKFGTLVSLANVITGPNATAPAHNGVFYANYRIEFRDVFGDWWFFEANFLGTAGNIKNERLPMQPSGAQRQGRIE